jgi:succinoglycan biosynthesis protein ExoA
VAVTVAVVVPCRNEAAHISALLDALAGQTRPPDEIIIVNDRSSDTTADVVRAWQTTHAALPVRIVEGAGRGPAAAMNVGIRATDADIIMRFDGHSVPARDYLERCLDVIGDNMLVAGGVWQVAAGADTSVARAIAAVVSHPIGSGGAQYRSADTAGPERVLVETVPFGTFPRAVWEQVGGFDESLAVNEDFDFNYRVRQTGLEVVLDRRIQATYSARPTLGGLARQYFRYGFWKVQMLRKDPRALHLRQVPPALALPWVAATGASVLLWPGATSLVAATMYPIVATVGAVHVAVTRHVNPLSALAAVATVHLSWSLGFWRGVFSGAPGREPGQSGTPPLQGR